MRILCLGAAMSYSICLFKHVVTSGGYRLTRVRGADRRRGLVRGSPLLILSLAGTESGYLTDAARRSGLFLS